MKKNLSFLIVLTLAFCFSCAKSHEHLPEGVYKARLEFNSCGTIYFSVIAGKIDPALVVAKWPATVSEKTFYNVCSVSNYCGFPSNIMVGDEFYFQIILPYPQINCGICTAVFPAPPKTLFIKVVQ